MEEIDASLGDNLYMALFINCVGGWVLLITSSDILLKHLDRIAKNHGERNMRLLAVMHKADTNKFGEPMLGRNEVVIS